MRLVLVSAVCLVAVAILIVWAAAAHDGLPNPDWDHPPRGNPGFDPGAPQRLQSVTVEAERLP